MTRHGWIEAEEGGATAATGGAAITGHSLNYLESRLRLPKLRRFREWLLDALRAAPGAA